VRLLVTGGSGFIGTHLVDRALELGHTVLNLDIKRPFVDAHAVYWKHADIMDKKALDVATREFEPAWVVHLAARTDCDENTTVEQGYQVNTRGTRNMLTAAAACPTVERLLMTSTQYVFNKGANVPDHDRDFHPVTVYGQSKVTAEEVTRGLDPALTWTIVRPTNVWGPWHLRQRANFFFAIQNGIYIHPSCESVKRSYGYAGNVVHQMFELLTAPREPVHRRVFYLGDEPIELLDWVNAFSLRLRGKPVRVAPYRVIRALARIGDGISRMTKRPFLITSTRFQSMTQHYVVPMKPTFDIVGPPRFTLHQGVDATVSWLRQQR
jgi:nucleoside-diphosphate-sugar epimerase